MLARRFQRFLLLPERVTSKNFYVATCNVHSNLHTFLNVSRNLHHFSTQSNLVPIFKGHTGFLKIEKLLRIIVRLGHTKLDDNDHEEGLISENTYARNTLLNSERDFKSFSRPFEPIEIVNDDDARNILSKDWHTLSPDEIYQDFVSLSCHAKLNGQYLEQEKHGEMLMALRSKLCQMSDENFRRIFQCLALWNNIDSTQFQAYTDLCSELDQECIKRLAGWNSEQCLLMCDYWYLLKLMKKTKFPFVALKQLGKKPRKLSRMDFLHFMFIINIFRKTSFNMYEVEYALDGLLEGYTANELGIVSMGFFKTQTPFRDPELVARINQKLFDELDNTDDISISAIMKMTRYSTGLRGLKILKKVLHALKNRVSGLSQPCLANIVHAASYVQCHNEELMTLIIERFERDVDNARVKDLERLSWALGIFDYDHEIPLYEKIVKSLRDPKRKDELERFPRIVPTILSHLSQTRIFPIDLIKQHLDPDFLKRVYGNNTYKIGWNFFSLENNLRIEMPKYDGPFLQPGIRDFLAKKFEWGRFQTTDRARPSDKFLLEVGHVCKRVLESESSAYIDQVLPHYVKPDIIICLDEINNCPVDPKPILSSMRSGTIKVVPMEAAELKWIAIVLAAQNQLINGTDRFVGPLRCKVRQLEIIGYTPVVININDWHGITNLDAKEDFLRKKVRPATNYNASIAAL